MKKILKLLGVFICCCMVFSTSAIAQQDTSPVRVDSLFNDLTAGTLSFEFDDPVTVTGYVIETGISIYVTPYVSLSDKKGGRIYAVCVLPRTDSLKLKNFSKDEEVVIEGNFYSLRDDRVVIKKCRKAESGGNNVSK